MQPFISSSSSVSPFPVESVGRINLPSTSPSICFFGRALGSYSGLYPFFRERLPRKESGESPEQDVFLPLSILTGEYKALASSERRLGPSVREVYWGCSLGRNWETGGWFWNRLRLIGVRQSIGCIWGGWYCLDWLALTGTFPNIWLYCSGQNENQLRLGILIRGTLENPLWGCGLKSAAIHEFTPDLLLFRAGDFSPRARSVQAPDCLFTPPPTVLFVYSCTNHPCFSCRCEFFISAFPRNSEMNCQGSFYEEDPDNEDRFELLDDALGDYILALRFGGPSNFRLIFGFQNLRRTFFDFICTDSTWWRGSW